jgi:alpha-glucoside transport system substrate-binding protein
VTGGADLVVAFNDNATVRSFVQYLSTAPAQEIWVERGGFTSVNNQVPLSAYPNVLAQRAAQQLSTASIFRFGAGDSMPSAVQSAWWAGVLAYLQNPGQLDSILQNIESVAVTAYQ